MTLSGLNTIRFNDITATTTVQKRIALAQAAVSQALKPNGLNIPSNQTARKVAEKLSPGELNRPCAYFCFGGDASVLIEGFGFKTTIGYDSRPMFNPTLERELNAASPQGFNTPLAQTLIEASNERKRCNYLYNGYLSRFDEIGSFMFFDIIGSGGSRVKVLKAENSDNLFKVEFDLVAQVYEIFFAQLTLRKGVMPDWLNDFLPGNVLIKAGDSGLSDPYSILNSIVGFLPAHSLIISDQELSATNLQPVVLTLTDSYRLFSDSFSISGSRALLPSYRPEPTPFGYSASKVFIYRVSENGLM